MSNLAMAAHHHHHHGLKLPKVKLPSLTHLEAKLSNLMAVAQGHQGTTEQRTFFVGAALTLILLVLGWRKLRRS